MANTLKSPLRPGGQHGLSDKERRDPVGLLVAGLGKVAQSDLLDRFQMRRKTEDAVFTVTSSGFKTLSKVSRTFTKSGNKAKSGQRVPSAAGDGMFDLTPTEDQQMLVDVVSEIAAEVLRPAAADADVQCATPSEVLAAAQEVGLPLLGVNEELGGIAEERSAVTGVLVHEALSHGDLGQAVAALAPGAVATAVSLWGSEQQQQTYLPAFTGDEVAVAALALSEPGTLYDALSPATTAVKQGNEIVLNGVKSGVIRGADCELFVVGAMFEGAPRLFVLESGAEGMTIESDPSMGVRAAGLSKLHLEGVKVPAESVLGTAEDYVECVRSSRLAWCALSLGVGQAILDYVIPYVNTRVAFGEPISHRQSVAFMVANIAIELKGMRLVTYKAASRLARGDDAAREVGLARKLCTDHGMRIGSDGVQLLGGHGFVKEHPVERWYRDLRAVGVLEGGVLV